jgi:hypothetical protein
MATMLSTLFSARRRQERNATRTPGRSRLAARPALEALDSRQLLTVTAGFDPVSGVLSIVSDGQTKITSGVGISALANMTSTTVTANSATGKLQINDTTFPPSLLAKNTISPAGYPSGIASSLVRKIVFKNEAPYGRDVVFKNQTMIDSDFNTGASSGASYGGGGTNNFYAGPGAAYCNGGSGTNYFHDSYTTLNDYNVGSGDNILILTSAGQNKPLSGHFPMFQDPFKLGGKSNTIVRPEASILDPYLKPMNLLNAGSTKTMQVVVDEAAGVLSLRSQAGAGFRILGNWKATDGPSGSEIRATGTLYLETGIQEDGGKKLLPITAPGAGLSFQTKALYTSGSARYGEFKTMNWGSSSLPIMSTGSGVSSLSEYGTDYGLDFSTSGLSWGVKLGADLADDTGLPLLGNVPYLYIMAGTGTSISFNDKSSVGTSTTGGALVFDPSDPAILGRFTTSAFTVAAGVSLRGAIPYIPKLENEDTGNPRIFGNLYTNAGDIALADLPFTISGEAVIDLDSNNDGKLAGLDADAIDDILAGRANLKDQIDEIVRDVSIGFNGSLKASTTMYGLNLEADMADASAFFKVDSRSGEQSMAFRVKSANLFDGTPLERFEAKQGNKFDVSASYSVKPDDRSARTDWGFSVQTSACAIGTVGGSALSIEASRRTNMARVSMTLDTLLGAAGVEVGGEVNLKNGDFKLTQRAYANLDLKVAKVKMQEDFCIYYQQGVFGAYIDVSASFQVGDSVNNIHGSVQGRVNVAISSSKFELWGAGRATFGVTALSISTDVSLGFGFSTHGFYFDALNHRIACSW